MALTTEELIARIEQGYVDPQRGAPRVNAPGDGMEWPYDDSAFDGPYCVSAEEQWAATTRKRLLKQFSALDPATIPAPLRARYQELRERLRRDGLA